MSDIDTPIYIIYSSWSIEKIKAFLGENCMLKIVFDINGNETNKTIAVMHDILYKKLEFEGYNAPQYGVDFIIKKYRLGNYILQPTNKSSNLFIPTIHPNTELYITSIINKKLQQLVSFNIIPDNCWKLKCPIDNRINGQVKLGCFVFFKDDITNYTKGVVRFLLNKTHWNDDIPSLDKYDNIFKCYWANNKKLDNKKFDKNLDFSKNISIYKNPNKNNIVKEEV